MSLERRSGISLALVVLVASSVACGTGPKQTGGMGGNGPATNDAGALADAAPTDAAAPTHDAAPPVDAPSGTLAAFRAELAADRPADAAGFQSRWPVTYQTTLPYDPLKAVGLDTIAASALGISDAERTLIARNGFAISARQTFPTFLHGYKGVYADHLPVYVSLDSVLHAIHRSYDSALMRIEQVSLNPMLTTLLASIHAKLGAGTGADFPAQVRADVDVYLAVARRLLGTTTAVPVAGGDATAVTNLVDKAKAASGIAPVSLFGETRYVDFTQFTPRGHYVSSGLENYFRAQMWLGRTNLAVPQVRHRRGPRRRARVRPATVPVGPPARVAHRRDGPATSGGPSMRRCGASWASPTTCRSPTSRSSSRPWGRPRRPTCWGSPTRR